MLLSFVKYITTYTYLLINKRQNNPKNMNNTTQQTLKHYVLRFNKNITPAPYVTGNINCTQVQKSINDEAPLASAGGLLSGATTPSPVDDAAVAVAVLADSKAEKSRRVASGDLSGPPEPFATRMSSCESWVNINTMCQLTLSMQLKYSGEYTIPGATHTIQGERNKCRLGMIELIL